MVSRSPRADEIKSVLKTFYAVFPNTKVYIGPNGWGFYFVGCMKKISDADFRRNAEKAFDSPAILEDLSEYNDSCVTAQKLHKMFLWENGEIETVIKDAALITDDTSYTEFFLWRFLLKGKSAPLNLPPSYRAQE